MAKLSDKQAELLLDKNFASVATIREDGTPHVTPVWVDYDGEHVVFNTNEDRVKPKHLRNDPRVNVTVIDRENPYRWISVTGKAELTHEGADEHIDKLAKKYMGVDEYPNRAPGERRVLVRVTPERVSP